MSTELLQQALEAIEMENPRAWPSLIKDIKAELAKPEKVFKTCRIELDDSSSQSDTAQRCQTCGIWRKDKCANGGGWYWVDGQSCWSAETNGQDKRPLEATTAQPAQETNHD